MPWLQLHVYVCTCIYTYVCCIIIYIIVIPTAQSLLIQVHTCKTVDAHGQLEGVLRTLTPRRALDVVHEVGAWIWIRDREQGYHNKREAAISHGRIRRSTREQQSHAEEHERIRRIARGANNKK